MGMVSAFFEGFTGGTLLSWAKLPGAPTQVFADQNSTQPQEALVNALLEKEAGVPRFPIWERKVGFIVYRNDALVSLHDADLEIVQEGLEPHPGEGRRG